MYLEGRMAKFDDDLDLGVRRRKGCAGYDSKDCFLRSMKNGNIHILSWTNEGVTGLEEKSRVLVMLNLRC